MEHIIKINLKKFTVHCSLFTVKREPLRGFTLVELLVVFAIMAILMTGGMLTFKSYNESQLVQASASDVVSMLSVARSRSLSQIKPTECTTRTLSGYRVTMSDRQYELKVVCGGNDYSIQTKTLPASITFASGSASMIFFSSGRIASSAAVVINGYSKTKEIYILSTGSITVNN